MRKSPSQLARRSRNTPLHTHGRREYITCIANLAIHRQLKNRVQGARFRLEFSKRCRPKNICRKVLLLPFVDAGGWSVGRLVFKWKSHLTTCRKHWTQFILHGKSQAGNKIVKRLWFFCCFCSCCRLYGIFAPASSLHRFSASLVVSITFFISGWRFFG